MQMVGKTAMSHKDSVADCIHGQTMTNSIHSHCYTSVVAFRLSSHKKVHC